MEPSLRHAASEMLNKQILLIDDDTMHLQVYWFRVASSERESLLTQNTRHTFFELHYPLTGSLRFLIDNSRLLDLPASSYLLVPPGRFHQIVECREPCDKLVLGMSVDMKQPSLRVQTRLFDDVQTTPAAGDVESYVNLIMQRASVFTPGSTKVVENLLQCMVIALWNARGASRPVEEPLLRKRNVKADYVARIHAVIRANAYADISVEWIASQLAISSRQLTRVCREETGLTPLQIINRSKLEYAKQLMMSTELSMSEIAESCSFSSEYALSRFFKDNEGFTPREYRRYSRL